jgi:hypothetical protein
LSTDSGRVYILGKALVYDPIEVVLLDEVLGVGECWGVLVGFQGVEEDGEGWGGEGVPGLGDGSGSGSGSESGR